MGFLAVNRDTVCRNFALCVCNLLIFNEVKPGKPQIQTAGVPIS